MGRVKICEVTCPACGPLGPCYPSKRKFSGFTGRRLEAGLLAEHCFREHGRRSGQIDKTIREFTCWCGVFFWSETPGRLAHHLLRSTSRMGAICFRLWQLENLGALEKI